MLSAQQRTLTALGALCVLLTCVAVMVSTDALVLHHVCLAAQVLALILGSIAIACLSLATHRLLTVGLRARRLRQALPLREGPTIDGIEVMVLDSPVPRAFAAGLLRPQVVVTEGALAQLGPNGMRALVAGQRHQARRRHGLRRVLADGLTSMLVLVPAAAVARDRYDVLLDLASDDAAARGAGGHQGLAEALLLLDANGTGVGAARIDSLIEEDLDLPSLDAAVAQGIAFVAVVLGLILVLIDNTRCVDIFYLQEHDATNNRWIAVPVLLLSAGVLLTLRRAALPGWTRWTELSAG